MTIARNFIECGMLPQVAMPFMNTVHCEELELVGGLLAKLETEAAQAEIDSLLVAWLEHTQEHFAREERLMQMYSFPPYPVHKMEHEQALMQLQAVQQHWHQQHDYKQLAQYIREEWRIWLQQHIATLDTVTAHYLSQFGIEVEL